MQIIIAKEKHDTRYLDASTMDEFSKSALKLLTERFESGYYYISPDRKFEYQEDALKDTLIEEQIKALPERLQKPEYDRLAAKQKLERERKEYTKWYDELQQVVKNQDLSIVTVGKQRPASYPIASYPIAWQFLQNNTDYEYESVELRKVESY